MLNNNIMPKRKTKGGTTVMKTPDQIGMESTLQPAPQSASQSASQSAPQSASQPAPQPAPQPASQPATNLPTTLYPPNNQPTEIKTVKNPINISAQSRAIIDTTTRWTRFLNYMKEHIILILIGIVIVLVLGLYIRNQLFRKEKPVPTEPEPTIPAPTSESEEDAAPTDDSAEPDDSAEQDDTTEGYANFSDNIYYSCRPDLNTKLSLLFGYE